MEKIVAALAAQHDELDRVVAPLDEAGWQRPSRCEGWSVADVVLHLAQTDELALASLRGTFADAVVRLSGGAPAGDTVDEGAAVMVARERGGPGADVLARWREGAGTLRRELAASDPARRVVWVAGELSARTLGTTRLAEAWIHTGDVATALGEETVADDRLWHIARLAWRTLPYAFARGGHAPAGPVAFRLQAPNGDTWHFVPDDEPLTVVEGTALDLCTVAGQRAAAADTGLTGTGPDARAVLDLVRTFA